MLRYKWHTFAEPSKQTDDKLIENYHFYRFLLKWTDENNRNELYDKIADLKDEIKKRNLVLESH